MSWYTDPNLYITRHLDGTFHVYRITRVPSTKFHETENLSFSKHLSLRNNKESDYDEFKASLPQSENYRHCINSRGSLLDWKYTEDRKAWGNVGPWNPFWKLPGIPQLKSVTEQDLEGKVSDMEGKIFSLQVEKDVVDERVLYLETENAFLKAEVDKDRDEIMLASHKRKEILAGLEAFKQQLRDLTSKLEDNYNQGGEATV